MPTGVLLYLILLIALVLAILITHFLVKRIAKTFSNRYSSWVYLVVSIFPLKEFVGILSAGDFYIGNPYPWFWIFFWLYCIISFWRTRSQWQQSRNNITN